MTDYNVVLLVEQQLTLADARQVASLHQELDDEQEGPVHYHVLLPLDDAAARVEASMGALSGGELLASPAMHLTDIDIDAVRRDSRERSAQELEATLTNLRRAGAEAVGAVVTEPPVDALVAKVKEVDGREVIILTRPHVVSEFFHLDWTSQARRKLGVPILHLLEHESFEEQAGGSGEGVTGL